MIKVAKPGSGFYSFQVFKSKIGTIPFQKVQICTIIHISYANPDNNMQISFLVIQSKHPNRILNDSQIQQIIQILAMSFCRSVVTSFQKSKSLKTQKLPITIRIRNVQQKQPQQQYNIPKQRSSARPNAVGIFFGF